MTSSKINAAWHAKHCACRPIHPKLQAEMRSGRARAIRRPKRGGEGPLMLQRTTLMLKSAVLSAPLSRTHSST